jgi:D-alanyl-D-alanine carboxypeptidase/D-alanyl-D-alanine-endopeptidase (penicillin-binding protein 4)
MKYFGLISALIFAVLQAGAQQKQTNAVPPASLEELQHRIDEVINQPGYSGAMWGVKIASLDSGTTWYSANPDKLFSPASNSKLYTMALALDRLGPDYRIKTSIYAASRPDASSVIKGDVIIYGRGDPTISSEFHGSLAGALEPFVAVLTNAGVKKIEGDLVGDDSFFHGPRIGSGWDWSDLQVEYGAEISALTLNSNVVRLVIKPGETSGADARISLSPATDYISVAGRIMMVAKGKTRNILLHHPLGQNMVQVSGEIPVGEGTVVEDVTVREPAGYFAAMLKSQLAARGITVTGRAVSVGDVERQSRPFHAAEWIELGVVESQPFRRMIASVEKQSQNLYTDLLLEHIGSMDGVRSGETSEEAGIAQLNKFLAKAGIPRGETIFDEGSGLSRNNLTTPDATVTLLSYMSRRKDFPVYYDALPIAGVDGTLRYRFNGTAAEGNLRAKTGTLRWASSLSGYMTNAAGEHLVFCMMLNRHQNGDSGQSKTHDMDAIVEMLAGTRLHGAAGH